MREHLSTHGFAVLSNDGGKLICCYLSCSHVLGLLSSDSTRVAVALCRAPGPRLRPPMTHTPLAETQAQTTTHSRHSKCPQVRPSCCSPSGCPKLHRDSDPRSGGNVPTWHLEQPHETLSRSPMPP